jgi:hypothetical protein
MKISYFLLSFLLLIGLSAYRDMPASFQSIYGTSPALADDDEEDEDDDDDEEDYSSSGSSSSKTVTQTITTYVTKQVPVTSLVTPAEYVTDTDGDGLVDAIDPDPKVPQKEYYTDDDGDSVPNALDKHPGEDDLAFFDELADVDGNGIIDTYENR